MSEGPGGPAGDARSDSPSAVVPDDPDDPEWPVEETVVVHENPWFTTGYDVVERPDGEAANYYWVDAPDAVSVVPVTDEGEVVLVEQYRPRQRGRFLEAPGGAVDPGEDPTTAARRELREETGYRAEDVAVLRTYRPSGWVRYRKTVAVATGLEPGEATPDDGEYLDVHVLSVDAVLDLASQDDVVGWLLTPLLLANDAGYL